MALQVGELYAVLKLERGEFDKSLRRSGNALTAFGKLAIATGAVVGGALALAIHRAVDWSEEYYKTSLKVSRVTGMNIEDSSKLVAVLEKFGIVGDGAVKVLGMMSKNIGVLTSNTKTEAKWEETFGFNLRNTAGHVKSVNALLLQAADYFNNKHIPATRKAALEAKLFGRSWQSMIPILSLGSKGLKQAEQAAAELGLELNAQTAGALQKYRESQLALNEAWSGAKLQLGLLVIPAFTAWANFLSGRLIPGIRAVIQAVHDWSDAHQPLIAAIGTVLGKVQALAAVIAGRLAAAISAIAGQLGRWVAAWRPVIDQMRVLTSAAFVDGITTISDALSKLGASSGAVLALAGAVLVLNAAVRSNPIIAFAILAVTALGFLKEAWDRDFGGIQETAASVWATLQPVFDQIAAALSPSGPIQAGASSLGASMTGVVDMLATAWQNAQPAIQEVLDTLANAFAFLTTTVVPALGTAFDYITSTILPPIVDAFTAAAQIVLDVLAPAFTAIVNVVRDNWPAISSIAKQVGDAIAAAAGVIAAVLHAVEPVIRTIAKVVFPILGAAAGVLLGAIDVAFKAIGVIWEGIVQAAQGTVRILSALFQGFAGVFKTIWDGIGGVARGAINFIIGIINGIISAIDSIQVHIGRIGLDTPAGFIGVGPFDWPGLQIPHLKYLASGTPSFAGGLAMLGERGPELAFLPHGTAVVPAAETEALLSGSAGPEVHRHYYLTVQGDLKAKDETSVLETLKRMAEVAA